MALKVNKKPNDAAGELTSAEQEVLSADAENFTTDNTEVSSAKTQKTIDLLTECFNLAGQGYSLTGYADKGNKISCTLDNGRISLTAVITDPEFITKLTYGDSEYSTR